jgi:site-specific DNA recombinase
VLDASEEALRRKPVRCAIYTRQSVSSSDALSSCEVRFEACRLYVESQREHGWTLLTERFDDDGYSRASFDRPGLSRLLALIRHGGVDQILVHRLDRLSQSVRHCVTLLDEFRRLEVALVVVTAPELGHSAQGSFMLNIMASFAEFEREIIATRIAESRAKLKSRQLRFAGGVPFGYESDPLTRQLVPNDEEAAAVR